MSEQDEQDDALIPADKVAEAYGIHKVVVFRWVKAGRIPRPVVQEPHYTRWSRNEIQADIRAMREAAKMEAAS